MNNFQSLGRVSRFETSSLVRLRRRPSGISAYVYRESRPFFLVSKIGRNFTAALSFAHLHHSPEFLRWRGLHPVGGFVAVVVLQFVSRNAVTPPPKLLFRPARKLPHASGDGLENLLRGVLCGLMGNPAEHVQAQVRGNLADNLLRQPLRLRPLCASWIASG